MPYIMDRSRKELNPKIEALAELIASGGQLNYVITRLAILFATRVLAGSRVPVTLGYNELTSVWSHLNAASSEFYRRVLAPYENKKREENGDVYNDLLEVIR